MKFFCSAFIDPKQLINFEGISANATLHLCSNRTRYFIIHGKKQCNSHTRKWVRSRRLNQCLWTGVCRTPQGVPEFSRVVPPWWGVQGCNRCVLCKNSHNLSHIMFLAPTQCLNFSQVLNRIYGRVLNHELSVLSRKFICTVGQVLTMEWSRNLPFTFSATVVRVPCLGLYCKSTV